MADTRAVEVIEGYLEDGEKVTVACTAYITLGLERIVLGVTDQRVLAVKSAYFSISDKGLLWDDPVDEVALSETNRELYMNGANTGNTYLKLRRADGSELSFNPRERFIGKTRSASANVELLYSALPRRF